MLKKYMNERVQLHSVNRFLRLVIFLLTLAFIVNATVMYYAIGKNRTIIIPAGISKPVELSDNDADDTYIRYITRYITSLSLTYTPTTVLEQFTEFLKLVHPSVYGKFETAFLKQADIVRLTLVSSVFYPENIKIDRNNKVILVSGKLTQIDARGSKIRDDKVTYRIKYDIDLGRFYVVDFVECKEGLCEK